MTNAATTSRSRVLGLLPLTGVVLFLIAEAVVLIVNGTSGLLEWTLLNAVLFLIGSSS